MSMPKLHVLAFSFALAALAPTMRADAQPQAPRQAPAARGFDVEARLLELQQRLMLDAPQTQRVRDILQSARARMDDLIRSTTAPRDEAFRLRHRQILWDVEDQIWVLLSCPQKDAFRLYVRERAAAQMERAGHHRGPRPGPGSGPGRGPGGGRGRPGHGPHRGPAR